MVSTNLRIGGLSSGIDTDSIVQDLMKAARAPLDKKVREKTLWTWKQADYRSINLSLLNLKNAAFNMKLESPFLAKQVTTEDAGIVTATAANTAAGGTYSIKVLQLATAASNASTGAVSADPDDKIDAGASILSQAAKWAVPGGFFDGKTEADTFTVTVNGEEFTFTYGDSLNGIIAEINENSEAAVSLFYDSATDRVALSSTVTGASAGLEVTGDFFTTVLRVDNLQKSSGTDASFELNGLQTTRSGNTFTINGVTFSLKGLTAGGLGGAATRVEVRADGDAVYNLIADFVNTYNEIYEAIDSKLKEERYSDYYPLTDEEKSAMSEKEIELWEEKAKSGLLKNDALLGGILSSIRSAMSGMLQGVDGPRSLAEIGITTGSYWDGNGGKLVINESKLRAALAEDAEGVASLFNNDGGAAGEQGVAVRLYNTLVSGIGRITSYAGSSSALYDQSYISRTIREIDSRIATLEERLAKQEERYWRQFTAMERAISSLNQQSSWLSSQFTSLQGQR
ncbi:MAG: flagellar filament capping protein FliD [Peptococcaceae bacterium]|jgi:flagellar hook-associated protein 2|nr:flagellar filament capping protein FliD [Peptococcaceae bacterium]MDH7524777.1 flagellar filament capping protein FliD [Peptococcaceae bacterium]